jgi:hypothetical protein
VLGRRGIAKGHFEGHGRVFRHDVGKVSEEGVGVVIIAPDDGLTAGGVRDGNEIRIIVGRWIVQQAAVAGNILETLREPDAD